MLVGVPKEIQAMLPPPFLRGHPHSRPRPKLASSLPAIDSYKFLREGRLPPGTSQLVLHIGGDLLGSLGKNPRKLGSSKPHARLVGLQYFSPFCHPLLAIALRWRWLCSLQKMPVNSASLACWPVLTQCPKSQLCL